MQKYFENGKALYNVTFNQVKDKKGSLKTSPSKSFSKARLSVPGAHTAKVGRYPIICTYTSSTPFLYLRIKRHAPLHRNGFQGNLKNAGKSSFIQPNNCSLIMCTGQAPFLTSLKTPNPQNKDITLVGKAVRRQPGL